MQKIQTFMHMLRHSMIPYDNYYHVIRKKTPFKASVKYFVALVAITTILQILFFSRSMVDRYPFTRVNNAAYAVSNEFPNDLVVTINEEGRLVTNYDRPFILFNPNEKNPSTLLVIDSKATRSKIHEYDAKVLLTEKEVVANVNDKIITFEYNSSPLVVNRETINLFGEQAGRLSSIFIVGYLFSIILIPAVMIVFRGVYMAILSFLVFIVGKQFIPKLKFKKTYQISLHAITAPLLIETFAQIFNIRFPFAPYWFGVLTIIFLAGAVYEAYLEPVKKKKKK